MDNLKPKYCFVIQKTTSFYWLPIIQKPIVFESFNKNGGWGIMWLNKLLMIRRPDSARIKPIIVK